MAGRKKAGRTGAGIKEQVSGIKKSIHNRSGVEVF
jgi:hypothetical protein